MINITSLFRDGTMLVRAHVWTAMGYSTRTFMNAGDALPWARVKLAQDGEG